MSGWTYGVGELAGIVGASPSSSDTTFTAISTDTRTLRPGEVFFALSGENFDGNVFVADAFAKGASAAVSTVASGTGPCLVVDDVLKALQAFAAHHRQRFSVPVIAITGSCGKTTTKDMVAAVLASRYRVTKTEGNLNNAIGMPLSLLRMDDATEAVVLEMGANHRGEIAELCAIARPTESLITMITEAHLEGFGSIDDVAAAKAEIVEGLGVDGVFYANQDDPLCRGIGERFDGKVVRVGDGGEVALRSAKFDTEGELILEIDPVGRLRLPLHVRAHAMNVAFAVAVGLHHGIVEFEEPLCGACRDAVRFRVERFGPVWILDDTYNANPASMRAALEALADRPAEGARIAVLGDMGELGAESRRLHGVVGESVGNLGIDRLYLRGEFARATAEGARASGVGVVEVMDDHADIARAIADVATPGDTVLVKGSRTQHMERVIDSLRTFLQPHDVAHTGEGRG